MLRPRQCALSWGVLLLSLLGCSDSTNRNSPSDGSIPGLKVSFTTQEDFQQGELSALSTTAEGDLRVDPAQELLDTPYLWIPNAGERTISQFDTKTARVVGTYALKSEGEGSGECYFPGEATVDLEGNIWIACRGEAQKDHDAVVAGDVPKLVGNRVLKLSKDRATVLLSVQVGYGPRALALDDRNHLWVGCSVDDSLWELDGKSGECYRGEGTDCGSPAITVADFPTTAAVDQRGHLWVVSRGLENRPHMLTEVNTSTGEIVGSYGPYAAMRRDGCQELYSLVVDQKDDLWLGGGRCGDVLHVKGAPGTVAGGTQNYGAGVLINTCSVGGQTSNGVAIDLDGTLWVTQADAHSLVKVDAVSGTVLTTTDLGKSPAGVVLDGQGSPWVIDIGSMSVHHLSILEGVEPTEITLGQEPAHLGDMAGTSLRQITHKGKTYAYWRRKLQASLSRVSWRQLVWDADVPVGSSLLVRSRCAGTELGLENAPWSAFFVESPGRIACGATNRPWLEVEVRFNPGPGPSPILHALTVTYEQG